MVYMDVHDKANALWECGVLDLFVVWEKGSRVFKLPILSKNELDFVLKQEGRVVCIELGSIDQMTQLFHPKIEKLSNADTITHDGFLYVRCNDIL